MKELYPTPNGNDSKRLAVSSSSYERRAPHVTIQTLAVPKTLGTGVTVLHQVSVNGETMYSSVSLAETLREVRKILARQRVTLT